MLIITITFLGDKATMILRIGQYGVHRMLTFYLAFFGAVDSGNAQ
jgi:hypothetical protein